MRSPKQNDEGTLDKGHRPGSDIYFECKYCRHHLVIELAGAGVVVRCPDCRKKIAIPKARPIRDPNGNLSKWLVKEVIGSRVTVIKRPILRVNGKRYEFRGGIKSLHTLQNKLLKTNPVTTIELLVRTYRIWEPLTEADMDTIIRAYEIFWYG